MWAWAVPRWRAVARGSVGSFLGAALRVRPGEGRQVTLMFFFLMCIVSAFILGRTVRDTLFLHRVDVDRLPFMYMVVAVSVAAVSVASIACFFERKQI